MAAMRRSEFPLLAGAIFVGAVGIGAALNYATAAPARVSAASSPYVIHLAPGEQVTIVADGGPTMPPGPTCEWTGTPETSGGPFPVITGLSVIGHHLIPGDYQAWAYGTATDGTRGYGQTGTGTADANGDVTLPFAGLRTDVPNWEAYVYRVPGQPSTTTVAECDWP